MTSTAVGLCPATPNDPTKVLRGDGAFGTLAYSSLGSIPSTFAPSAHGSTHLDNGADVIPLATSTRTGLAPKLSGSATTFLNGTGAYTTPAGGGDMLKSVYDTGNNGIVDKAESLTNLALTTAMVGDAQITGTKIAGGTITGSNIAANTIANSNIVAATITNASLAAGVAVANLGYTPINGAGGDYTATIDAGVILRQNSVATNASALQLYKHSGYGANAVYSAPLVIGGVNSSSRPQITFNIPSTTIRSIGLDSTSAFIMQDSAGGLKYVVEGTAINQVNLPFYFNVNDILQITSGRLYVVHDTGLAASSWSSAPITVQSATTAGRAGIGFYTTAWGAVFLYLQTDGKLHFIDSAGTDHIITSS